jgi:hypothetical protein
MAIGKDVEVLEEKTEAVIDALIPISVFAMRLYNENIN